MLTPLLKRVIEAKSRLMGESLSAYLRKAAVLRLMAEDVEKQELASLAESVVGSVKARNHSEWSSKAKVRGWVRKLREDWE